MRDYEPAPTRSRAAWTMEIDPIARIEQNRQPLNLARQPAQDLLRFELPR
jgi:hypothetical protein